MNLFLAPHSDDEALFGAFTLWREHPLVVICTDSWIQFNRGDNITAEQRWLESVKAMEVLDCPIVRLGIRDDILGEEVLKDRLSRFANFETIYAPAFQGGHPQHDLVSKVATDLWGGKVRLYTTYTPTELHTTGNEEIIPTENEIALKESALDCYKSQINLPSTAPHFKAIEGKSEWFI